MKKMLLGCVLLAAAATAAWAAEGREGALHARAVEFKAAWDRHDPPALAAFWADDGDLINPFGRVAKGRAEIEKLFRDEHSTFLKGTTFNLLSDSSREIAPDVAVAEWEIEITGIQGPDGAMPPFKNHITLVWVKKGGAWWAAAARPVSYPPPPGAPAPPK